MKAGLRRAVLSAHLTVSIGWIGAVLAYLALGVVAVTTSQPETIRAAWVAMELTGWYVIVPLALVSFASGIVMALGTKWGLFRHYWVIFSLGLTGFAVTVLMLHMPEVSAQAAIARTADARDIAGLGGDLGHPAIGLLVLLAVQVLNLYKPRGLTRHGYGVQQQPAGSTAADPSRLAGRWLIRWVL
jgi:hypothetical protein